MQAAVRSYLTAGVATVGAGVIALSPIAPPMPAVHLPSVHQAEVALSAAAGPIETWIQVINATAANLNAIGQQLAADPAPILQQIIANQKANGAIIGADSQQVVKAITDALQAYPATLQTALGQIAAGNIVDGANTLLSPVIGDALNIIVPLTDAIQKVSVNMTTTMANALGEIQSVALTAGGPLLGAFVYSPVNAVAAIAQTVVDDARTNPLGAINALLNAPATMVGAVLNGYGPGPLGSPQGLLGPSTGISLLDGLVPALLSLRDEIAKAIAPQKTQTTLKALATPAAAALPAGGTTVTLSTGTASTTTPASKAKPVKVAPTATATDSATDATAASPAAAKHHAQSSSATGSTIKKATGGTAGKSHRSTGHAASSK
jgi:hypothetical protein